MSSENKVVVTRVIFGVASVGATLALVYLYNKYQQKKGEDGDSSGGSRLRRQSGKSGEVTKKVTFKTDTDDDDEKRVSISKATTVTVPTPAADSKSTKNELIKQPLPLSVQPVATHDAPLHQCESRIKDEQPPSPSGQLSSAITSTITDDDMSSNNTTINKYENNSTLKLEDSTITNSASTTTTTTTPASVASVKAPAAVKEEVISRSSDGPLMTSTPLPGKNGVGQTTLRAAAPVFEPHSDLQNSAQVDDNKETPKSALALTPETDYDAFSLRKEMRIPREIVPGLIGKKGCNIKGIQAQSGTTINFSDETLDNGDRLCVIRGAPANVTIAESMIEKFIIDQPIIYTETLTVPLSAVGRIIGRGGETIRTIQDYSRARVNVESHNHYGTGDSGPTRSITIKGSEEQISAAKQLITEKVDEERNLRKNIDLATASRTPRRGGVSPSNASSVGTGPVGPSSSNMGGASSEAILPLKQDGILEVFVSCVYHPNDFWIQVVGRDSIELDKLCESMTDYYSGQKDHSEPQFSVGDIVAAPFEVDGKIYRAKIMRIDDSGIEVSYLDYGDRRILPVTEVFELHPNFLKLRYQAIQATLNLGCIGDKWEDEVINEFCDLTYCAQWQSLTARVKDYLKDSEDGHDVIWIQLLDKTSNIGEELVRKGLASPKGPSGCNGAGAQSSNKKSYAAAALGVGIGSTSTSSTTSGPFISSSDPTVQESAMESDRNGN